MSKKALIFGISGQDGAYLSELLIKKGYVHGTSRDAEINPFTSLMKLGIKDLIKFHSVSTTDFRSVLHIIRKLLQMKFIICQDKVLLDYL